MTQPTLEPKLSRKEAKAQAAAAKAYAKAQGNFFTRHKILTGLMAFVAVIIVIVIATNIGGSGADNKTAGNGGNHAKTHKSTKAANSGKSVEGGSAYGTSKLPLQNGDWRLDSIQVKNDGLGDFGATGRITYTGSDTEGGDNIFTVTVFKGTKVVATLTGSANTVKPDTAVTVQFISSDTYVAGPFKYDFQNDL
jgi:hypothetical protein